MCSNLNKSFMQHIYQNYSYCRRSFSFTFYTRAQYAVHRYRFVFYINVTEQKKFFFENISFSTTTHSTKKENVGVVTVILRTQVFYAVLYRQNLTVFCMGSYIGWSDFRTLDVEKPSKNINLYGWVLLILDIWTRQTANNFRTLKWYIIN